MPPEPAGRATAALRPGERLIWSAAANPARMARRRLPFALFGLVVLVFFAAWMNAAAAAGPLNPFVALPSILAGLALLLWPAIAYLRAGRTTYALTDQRALILCDAWPPRSCGYGPADFTTLEVKTGRDGLGDVVFRKEDKAMIPHSNSQRNMVSIGFFGVAEPERVAEAVRRLAEAAVKD
ncbi:MAG: hypothetical protein MI806_18245 [Minwuiales bacterium]|nr:hypothetical protein [Minwuiales bacterium]